MEMNAANPATTVREVGLPIYQSKGWLKFLGVLSILQGIMAAITLVGLVIAWLPIWIGVVLHRAPDVHAGDTEQPRAERARISAGAPPGVVAGGVTAGDAAPPDRPPRR